MSIGSGEERAIDLHEWGRCQGDCSFCSTERERPADVLFDDPEDDPDPDPSRDVYRWGSRKVSE